MRRFICLLFLLGSLLFTAMPVEAGCGKGGRAKGERKLVHRVKIIERFRKHGANRVESSRESCSDGSCSSGPSGQFYGRRLLNKRR